MADRKPGRGSDQFPLRLPDGMRDRIREAAEANGRSMNAEIVARLEESFLQEQYGRYGKLFSAPEVDMIVEKTLDRAIDTLIRKGWRAPGQSD